MIKYMEPESPGVEVEGSGLYGGVSGGRDLHSVEFWCHRGIHNGAVRMTGSPWGL